MTAADPVAGLFTDVARHAASFAARTGKRFVSFAAGAPDVDLLPHAELARIGRSSLADHRGMLNYADPRGLPALRHELTLLLRGQGVECREENVLVTSGGMEALSLAGLALVDAGDRVLSSVPTFPGALALFSMLGAAHIGYPAMPQARSGPTMAVAIGRHRPTLTYLMPDSHNPTGSTATGEDRHAIATALRETAAWAVEDGSYALLHHDGDQPPPIQADAPDRVLYAWSASKFVAPALRIGALVGPTDQVDRAYAIKSVLNMQASALHQHLLAEYLAGQRQLDHPALDTLRRALRARRDAMTVALEATLPPRTGFAWDVPAGGMFLWLRCPPDVDPDRLLPQALDDGVAYAPPAMFTPPDVEPPNGLRLNFAGVPTDQIDTGVRRLARVLTRT